MTDVRIVWSILPAFTAPPLAETDAPQAAQLGLIEEIDHLHLSEDLQAPCGPVDVGRREVGSDLSLGAERVASRCSSKQSGCLPAA